MVFFAECHFEVLHTLFQIWLCPLSRAMLQSAIPFLRLWVIIAWDILLLRDGLSQDLFHLGKFYFSGRKEVPISLSGKNCVWNLTQSYIFWCRPLGTVRKINVKTVTNIVAILSNKIYVRLFHMHTKLAIMALMLTLYSHIFAVFFIICIFRC